jgi:hypothetical protein
VLRWLKRDRAEGITGLPDAPRPGRSSPITEACQAERLQALVDRHPTGTIDVAWDHAATHADAEIEAIVRAAVGRLV